MLRFPLHLCENRSSICAVICGADDWVAVARFGRAKRRKGNQGTLLEDVKFYFDEAQKIGFKGIPYDYCEMIDKDHGRLETRCYYTVTALDGLRDRADWKGWNIIRMVEATRELNGKVEHETRYFVGSLGGQAARGHWGIENQVHWVLDIAFR